MNAIARIEPYQQQNAIVPFSMDDIERMAGAIAKSGLFGVKSAEQAIALMLVAQAEGQHPAIIARDYDVIQGRPAKKAEAMLRSFIAAGGMVKWHELTDAIADAEFIHPQGGTVRITWDMERAKVAGLNTKDTWRKFPRQMLRSRVISEGVRTVCPAATSGMYVPEEVRDMGNDPDPRPTFEPAKAAGAEVVATVPAEPVAPATDQPSELDQLLLDLHGLLMQLDADTWSTKSTDDLKSQLKKRAASKKKKFDAVFVQGMIDEANGKLNKEAA